MGLKYPNTYEKVSEEKEEHVAVKKFREYLRIKTVHPKPDYQSCKDFLTEYGKELGLEVKVVECVAGKPIVILSWLGKEPTMPTLMLNSHTDVVPVFEDCWSRDPFAADKVVDSNGDTIIIARGSQDMKIVGILYLEAIRALKTAGEKPLRTIHVTFVPDEEIDGFDGMNKFIHTEDFKILNVGLALDEGISNTGDAYKVFYGERSPWKARFTTTGNVGHGSKFIRDLATDKLMKIAKKLRDFRFDQEFKLTEDSTLALGDVTTVNLTMLQSGVQANVVPQNAEAVFDIRVSPHQNLQEFKAELQAIADAEGAKLDIYSYFEGGSNTSINENYPWWKAFSSGCAESGIAIEPEIFPAATDSRYLRQANIPAYGVSPLRNTPILLHDHDEYVREDTVFEGLKFYTTLLPHLFNLKA